MLVILDGEMYCPKERDIDGYRCKVGKEPYIAKLVKMICKCIMEKLRNGDFDDNGTDQWKTLRDELLNCNPPNRDWLLLVFFVLEPGHYIFNTGRQRP